MARINVYAGGILDRVTDLREDDAWLAERRADPRSRYAVLWRGQFLVVGGAEPSAALLSVETVAAAMPDDAPVALLGLDGEVAYFAADLSAHDDDPSQGMLAGHGEFQDLRTIGAMVPAPDAALLAHAQGLFNWYRKHRFCGVCGAPTEISHAGHQLRCSDAACGADHFPRVDPAVIMLVADGERCLMGRQKSWPDGQYSTLAGFVEPGESLEEAVAREVMEESGIVVEDVRYHSSQPWPFPASMMLGFHARAVTTEIRINHEELEDARWFERAEMLDPKEGFRLPRRQSIARRLVDDWLNGEIYTIGH